MTKTQFTKKLKNNVTLNSPWLKNKLINCGIYMVSLLILIFVNYFGVFKFQGSIWIWLDILLMILSVSPIFFFKGTMFDRIYLPIIFALITILITININYYKFFGVVLTIKDLKWSISNIDQIGVYLKDLNWAVTITNVVLFGLELSAIEVFNIKYNFKETTKNKNPKRKVMNIIAGVTMGASLLTYEFSMGMWVISEKSKNIQTIKYVNYNSNYHFKKLGMLSFYNREIRQMMTDKGATDQQIISWLKQARLVQDKYTGILDNPNIFVIMIETGDRWMLNEYTTPNLWKIFKTNGIYGAHNYSQNHTNVSNILGITGSYPLEPLMQTYRYTMPFALPQILKGQNYNTRFYYDIVEIQDSYRDMKFAKIMGFDNCFFHKELIPSIEPWSYLRSDFTRDSIVADAILDNLKQFHTQHPNDKIYSHWMTMFMHGRNQITSGNKEIIQGLYDEFGDKLKDLENRHLWTNPCTNEKAKATFEIYTLKTMDFDKAIGKLISYFYDSSDPMLNNTIFVAFGDHSIYEFAGGEMLNKQIKHIDVDDDINLYSTMFGLYHPLLTEKIKSDNSGLFNGHDLQKMTSSACITPTILDLMRIPYVNNIYQDQSIFDLFNQLKYNKDNDDIYYSNWLNYYMNENYTSTNSGSITKVLKDDGKQNLFVEKLNQKQQQLRILNSIYHNDFFDRYNYEDFIPKSNFINNFNKEVAIVKYYE